MKSFFKTLPAALILIVMLAALFALSSSATDGFTLPDDSMIAGENAKGYCLTGVTDGTPTYSNIAWAVYKTDVDGEYALYFYIDEESENTESTKIHALTSAGAAPTSKTTGDLPWGAYYSGIKEVYIGDGITEFLQKSFLNLPVTFVEVPTSLSAVGLAAFQGCSSLKNINIRGKSYTKDTMDLSAMTWFGSQAFENCTSANNYILPPFDINLGKVFSGNTALTSITLPGSYNYTGRPFFNCTALEEITILGQPTFSTSDNITFEGCLAVKTVKFLDGDYRPEAGWLEADAVPNVTFICMNEEQAEHIKTTFSTEKVEIIDSSAPLVHNGFQIRTEDYNGLRSIFTFDATANKAKEAEGYSLVEFGAIILSKETYDSVGGVKLTYDESKGAYVTADDKIFKLPVYSDGAYSGKVLEHTDTHTTFAATVINFDSSNYNKDVYSVGYTIYGYQGENIITYVEYDNSSYRSADLYQVTLGMYTDGVLNASHDKDNIIWNTLKLGAVSFAADSGAYTYIEGMTDMKGVQDFSRSFTALEIPVVTWATADGVTTFTQSGDVTVTLLDNPSDGSYVAVYRSENGNGVIPASSSSTKTQLSPGSAFPNYAGETPMPKLEFEPCSLVKTVILDYGITEIGSYGFTHMEKCEKYVYSSTLSTINDAAFYCNRVVSTAFCSDGKKHTENVIDLGAVATMNTTNAFTGVNNSSVTKIVLPQDCFASTPKMTKTVGHYFGQSFTNTLKVIVVPDGCEGFTSQALTTANFATDGLKIVQTTYNSKMASSVADKTNLTYCKDENTTWAEANS